MLPKSIYELMPFICLVTGGLCASFATSNLMFLGGLFLFIAGAAIRIMRSHHRRLDSRENKRQQQRLRSSLSLSASLPEPLYEALPYLYMVVSFILLQATSDLMFQLVAATFFAVGLFVLLMRRRSRINKKHCDKHLEI
ncbi:MAG: hypothetical protein ACPGMR_01845 [Pontibacterium sp.]